MYIDIYCTIVELEEQLSQFVREELLLPLRICSVCYVNAIVLSSTEQHF